MYTPYEALYVQAKMTCDLEIFVAYVIANHRPCNWDTPPAAFFSTYAVKSVHACVTRNSYTKPPARNAEKRANASSRAKERGGKKRNEKRRYDLDSYVPLAREGGALSHPTKTSPAHGRASLLGNLRSRPGLFPFPRVRHDRRDGSALTMNSTHPFLLSRGSSSASTTFILFSSFFSRDATSFASFLSLCFRCR